MKALVINAKKTYGKKKSDGTPYEMYVVTVSLPLRNISMGNYNVEGYGHDIAEIPLEPSILPKFQNLKEPTYLELVTDQVIMFGEMKDTVVDVRSIQPAVKSA